MEEPIVINATLTPAVKAELDHYLAETGYSIEDIIGNTLIDWYDDQQAVFTKKMRRKPFFLLRLQLLGLISNLRYAWSKWKHRNDVVELDDEDRELEAMTKNLDWSQAVCARGRPHREVHAELRVRKSERLRRAALNEKPLQ
jgi:hypothetical protein